MRPWSAVIGIAWVLATAAAPDSAASPEEARGDTDESPEAKGDADQGDGAPTPTPASTPTSTAAGPMVIAAARSAPSAEGSAVLIGRLGKIYLRQSEQLWQRIGPGGVAVDLVSAAAAAASGDHKTPLLFAAGERTPVFRFEDGVWRVEPLPVRGRVILAEGGAVPALAVGRAVFLYRDKKWQRAFTAGAPVTALVALGTKSIVAGDRDGHIWRWNGKRLARVRAALGRDEHVTTLIASRGSRPATYAKTSSGHWLRLERSRAVVLAAPADPLESLCAAVDTTGDLWVVGTPAKTDRAAADPAAATQATATPAVTAPATSALWKSTQRGLVEVSPPPPFDRGDRCRVAFAGATAGTLHLATERGALHIRDASGRYTRGLISDDLARTRSSARTAPSNRNPPARTR